MNPAALPVVDLGPPVFTGRAGWTDLAALVGVPGPLSVVLTRFEAGAGTAWHTHEHPQVLVVTAGTGVLERAGREGQVIATGEVAVVPAGVVHRHAPAGDAGMTHVSVSAAGDLTLT